MIGSPEYSVDIVETNAFVKQIRELISEEEVFGLKTYLASNPLAGDVISGGNGVRKLRWAMENRGKSRGARVVYYYRDLNMPLFLITAYAKSEKANLSRRELKLIGRLVDELVEAHSEQLASLVLMNIAQKGA